MWILLAAAVSAGMHTHDTGLMRMDQKEAIRQLEREIEEQIERNHYIKLGI